MEKKRAKSLSSDIEIIKKDEVIEEEVEDMVAGEVIYLSVSEKQKRLALYLFIFLIGLMGVYGIVRK